MKAKLIKKGDVYFLDELKIDGYFTIANSLAKPNGLMYNLSLKNCQAIERGYDLDELAIESDFKNGSVDGISFKLGFQKALELIGDKKFSEEDIRKAIMGFYMDDKILIESNINKQIQSLQQTEWDVEIEMEEGKVVESHVWDGTNHSELTWVKQPKLNANGCLILKKILQHGN